MLLSHCFTGQQSQTLLTQKRCTRIPQGRGSPFLPNNDKKARGKGTPSKKVEAMESKSGEQKKQKGTG
jgi:hypothetical protein